ncbi:MAG: fliK, partial [Symbiobacteriaceae bacterium]|jgi:flagellar hook-length control protein FliK|nr:fliK [Symbiobacteriaceae bacterium]
MFALLMGQQMPMTVAAAQPAGGEMPGSAAPVPGGTVPQARAATALPADLQMQAGQQGQAGPQAQASPQVQGLLQQMAALNPAAALQAQALAQQNGGGGSAMPAPAPVASAETNPGPVTAFPAIAALRAGQPADAGRLAPTPVTAAVLKLGAANLAGDQAPAAQFESTGAILPQRRTEDRELATVEEPAFPLRFDLIAREAVAGEGTTAATNADAAAPHTIDDLIDKVAGTAREAKDGTYTLNLRLYPEHLGEVRLQLRLSGHEVQTVFQVATPEARQALEHRFDQLRQSLLDSGLQLSGFDVQTGDRQRRPWERENPEWQGRYRRPGEQSAPINPADLQRMRRFTTLRSAGGLDIIA